MTLREVRNAIDSKIRVMRVEARERANYDYIQAQLIVRGVSICLGDKSEFPSLEAVYPGIFAEVLEEQKQKAQERKDQLSALRFQLFAQSYNNKFKNKEVPK